MSTYSMTYSARCQHCKHLGSVRLNKVNGEPYKRETPQCKKTSKLISKRDLACTRFELV